MCVLIAVAAGCTNNTIAPQPQVPEGFVSAGQLAGQTGLKLVRCTPTCAVLEGGPNSVVMICDPGGAIYVNGKQVCSRQRVIAAEDTVYVPAEAVSAVRSRLRSIRLSVGAPPPAPDDTRILTIEPLSPEPLRETPVKGVVVLDAGHGGSDPGTMAYKGMMEKELNLKIAQAVRDRLARRGVKVIMTRDSDVLIDLTERAEIANRNHADLFVSIHCNSSPDPSTSGSSVIVDASPDASSLRAANLVSWNMSVHASGRGVMRDVRGLRVLVKNARPAMLVEAGYLSNRAEARLISSDSHVQLLADDIAAGILEYLRVAGNR
jgi:N-acetylmuramoyl-L-alanine amidase